MARIAIVVGEASGDQLGGGLIRALRARAPECEFVGVTGPQMCAAGCRSWADYQGLAVMGLVEVLRHIPSLLRLRSQLKQRLREERPDVLIGIDAPDFNLGLERYAKGLGVPTVHYVCPSVWAWRQGRVNTIRKAADRVLCLLPFEAGFLQQHGVAGEFVGHPLADELCRPPTASEARARLGLTGNESAPVLAVLPGSRAAEVDLLGPVFLDTVVWLRKRKPGLKVLIAAASETLAAALTRQVEQAGLADDVAVKAGATRTIVSAADSVLLASGTATLETMLLQRPMVVAYRMHGLTAWLARRLVKARFAALPNLLADRAVVPEFLQEAAVPERLGEAVLAQLDNAAERDRMLATFAQLGQQLRRGASDRAAEAVLTVMEEARC